LPDAGQATVFGKGGTTRVVLLPASVWRQLESLGRRPADAPAFPSRRGRHLETLAIWRIIRQAARRAGLDSNVSPHWLRQPDQPTRLSARRPSTWSPRHAGTPRAP
jgi:integrase/recombinase XerD